MELAGTQEIRRDPAGVWASLNDSAVLQQCIPGCEAMLTDGENAYRVTVMAAVGPVKTRFTGRLLLSDVRPQEGYTLTFEGTGGAAGFAKGGATVSLAPTAGGTMLSYSANAKVGGKLAQVGSRLIDGVAAKMSTEFFARFKEVVEVPVPGSVPVAQGDPAATIGPDATGRDRWSRSTMAIGASIACAVVIAMFWYFSRGGH
jgi:uncharacterized protein